MSKVLMLKKIDKYVYLHQLQITLKLLHSLVCLSECWFFKLKNNHETTLKYSLKEVKNDTFLVSSLSMFLSKLKAMWK